VPHSEECPYLYFTFRQFAGEGAILAIVQQDTRCLDLLPNHFFFSGQEAFLKLRQNNEENGGDKKDKGE